MLQRAKSNFPLTRFPVRGWPVDGAYGGVQVVDPLTLPSLELFLNAKEITSLFQDSALTTPVTTNNDPVGGWVDLAVHHNHTQATAGSRGTYLTNGINGYPAVAFDGDALEKIGSLFSIDACYGFALVQQTTINTIFQRIWSMKPAAGDDFNQNNSQIVVAGPTTSQTMRIQSRLGAADTLNMSSAYVTATPYLFQWHRDGSGNATGKLNSTALSDTYTDGTDTPAWSVIGSQRYVGPVYQEPWRGRISCVIFGIGALSASEIAGVEAWFLQEYGVSV